MPRPSSARVLLLTSLLAATPLCHAAEKQAGSALSWAPETKIVPVAQVKPPMPARPGARNLKGFTVPDEPEHPTPPARDFTDTKYKVSLHLPAGWNFEKKDGILSNFGVETRTARRGTDVRGVAELNFNPWPPTTFAGALFYYSVIPRSNTAACAEQTTTKGMKPLPEVEIDGVRFHHGRDQHGSVCIEARDEAFTTMRGNSCMRFDMVINTFCSEMSGSMEINPMQLKDVQTRLAGILGSVKFGK